MARRLSWMAGASLLLLAGAAVGAARASRRGPAPLPRAIPPLSPSSAVPVVRAALLLQRRDCSGNLRWLHWLHTPPLASGIGLAVLWYAGPATDSTAIRSLLPAWTATVPLRPVPKAMVRDLRALGHTATPVLMVLDADDRVRLVTQAPRSPREAAGVRRALEGLTWFEDR